MIQIIAAIVVGVWFFRSAREVGKSGVGWAIIGVVAFFAPSIAWLIFAGAAIVPALMKSDLGDAGAFIGILVGLVGLGLASVVVFWVHRKNLRTRSPEPTEESPLPTKKSRRLPN